MPVSLRTATRAPSRSGEIQMATDGPARARSSGVQPTGDLTDATNGAEVDVWTHRVDLAGDPRPLTALLDDVELDRAARFRFERDRARFVARRAFLREVLAAYVDVAPAELRYRLSEHRRPELDPALGLTFSTSHSDGLAVVAVTQGRRLGVDIERNRDVPDVLGLALGVCTPEELDDVLLVAPARRGEAFLRIWTRKEACLKAVGTGLGVALDSFHVGDADGGRELPGAGGSFVIVALDGIPNTVGAIAVEAARVVVRRIERGPELLAAAS